MRQRSSDERSDIREPLFDAISVPGSLRSPGLQFTTIHRMTVSATSVRFDEHTIWVDLTDGRKLGIPLAWFPRLLRATPAEREQVKLSRVGLHWETIDEDIAIAGLLLGRPDDTLLPRAK
jgi:hypothetical protein